MRGQRQARAFAERPLRTLMRVCPGPTGRAELANRVPAEPLTGTALLAGRWLVPASQAPVRKDLDPGRVGAQTERWHAVDPAVSRLIRTATVTSGRGRTQRWWQGSGSP